MTPILTITLNPAIDAATSVDAMRAGVKLRCGPVRRDPGGGGVNVARVITRLGGDAVAWLALGGPTGARLQTMLQAEGVPTAPFTGTGETRQNLSVFDAAGQAYRLSLPGPDWSEPDVSAALDDLTRRGHGDLSVLSGSLPPGVPLEFPARLARALPGYRLIVDIPTAPLRALAASPPDTPYFCLRMDADEAAGLASRPLPDPAATRDFARSLIARGIADTVIIARGAAGSVLVTADSAWTCAPPAVSVVSKIGAGDSFVAAFALSIAQGAAAPDALAHGAAAAAACVMTPGTDLCHKDDVDTLRPDCRPDPI